MTKFEVRIAAMAALEIDAGDTLIDIGAGTGSISVEAALQGADVYAVEEKHEAAGLIKQNNTKFNAGIHVVEAGAPAGLKTLPAFNKCFIGGSGGRLTEIANWADNNINEGGIIAATFITINNLNTFIAFLKKEDYADMGVKLLQVSDMDRLGLLRANNPIFIVRGRKK